MSQLDKLIAELCPDGVEFKALGDVVEVLDNLRKPISKDKREPGNIPYYGANGIQGYIKGYIFDGTYLLLGEDGSVINKDRSPVLNWAEGRIWVNNHAHVLGEKPHLASLRYVYFYLSTLDVSDVVQGTPPKINQANMRAIRVALPPLEVQSEIVKVLDSFTQLEAELEAELEARRRQYRYYRDALLTLSEAPRMLVGDLFDFKNGLNKGKEFFGKGSPIVNFVDVFKNQALTESMINGRVEVTQKELDLYSARKNDVFFTRTSETREEIGKVSVLLDDIENCVFSGFVLRARPKTKLLLPKFCAYIFSSPDLRKEIIRNSSYTTRALTNGGVLSRLRVPIPSTEEQARIVSILDKFDALVNDLSSGLPAEIKVRRQQYQHYRDRLLTFKEAA